MKRVLALLVFGAACFSLGWVSQFILQTDKETPAAAINTAHPATGSHSATGRSRDEARGPDRSNKAAAGPEKSPRQAFREALDAGDYEGAVMLIESTPAPHSARLRDELLSRLERTRAAGDMENFSALAHSHLDRFYDDVDVWLILARGQAGEGYIDESARSLQMASTYALTGPERSRVRAAVSGLAKQAEKLLPTDESRSRLLAFYQLLRDMDISLPGLQLRQAELHLLLADLDSARVLATPLAEDPEYSDEANRLLAAIALQDTSVLSPQDPRQAVALVRRGDHYLIPVTLNGRSPVTLMIDTGASISSLSLESFVRLPDVSAFTHRGSRQFSTANGITEGDIYRAETLSFGDITLRDVHIAVLPGIQGGDVDGLLGMNILQAFKFEIDQDEALLYLQPR